jgi:hypothetical protein
VIAAARQYLTPDKLMRTAYQEGKSMAVYVAEIGGKAVFAFGAEDEFAAKRFVEGEWLGSDLMVYESQDGTLPWNGKTKITVREAQDAERMEWRKSRDEAPAGEEDGEDGSDANGLLVYLMPIHDLIDDD